MQRVILAVFCSLLLAGSAQAEEKIISYNSDIIINKDASIDVTEHIQAQSEGVQIRHGIYRDFPLRYTDKQGHLRKAEFGITSIRRDGQQEQYHTENIGGGIRIYLGRGDYLLPNGVYNYDISYHTSGWLGFFEAYDELYWNVTGNGWSFPIEQATATVHLPTGASASQMAAYTGPEGGKGTDYTSSTDAVGNVVFATTRRLEAHEGITVAVGWPKGFVTEKVYKPSFLKDNRGAAIAGLFFLIAAVYYYNSWNKVGRDPKQGTIIPLFTPPDNLSPVECAYIYNMGGAGSSKNFAAAIVDMAVKGFLKITDLGHKKYTLTKIANSDAALSEEEKAIAGELFEGDNEITIGNVDNHPVQSALSRMSSALSNGWKGKNFAYNFMYMFPGILISLLVIIGFYLSLSDSGGFSGISVNGQDSPVLGPFYVTCFASFVCFAIASTSISIFRKSFNDGSSIIMPFVFLLLFALPALGAEIYWLHKISKTTGPLSPIFLGLTFFINFNMPGLLKAPTVEGRARMDKIEGFRMYLNVAEKDRLNKLNPPEVTPEIFEKYLPYAIALEMEQEWGEKFASSLANSATQRNYQPIWYIGGSNFSGNNFASDFSSNLASGLSSSIASSSSSGSSGGGSSGGGGGGGGGGGW